MLRFISLSITLIFVAIASNAQSLSFSPEMVLGHKPLSYQHFVSHSFDEKWSVVSCGIVFLDDNKVSGIHMIGTIPEYRGLELGKIMTSKLLFEAFKNRSKTAVLVASEVGERIYSKMRFAANGSLQSYSVK